MPTAVPAPRRGQPEAEDRRQAQPADERPARPEEAGAGRRVRNQRQAGPPQLVRRERQPGPSHGVVEHGPAVRGSKGRQIPDRHFPAKSGVFPGQVLRQHGQPEQQRERSELRQPAQLRRVPADQRRHGAERRERRQQRVHVPAEQQRRARLRQQLPEAPPFVGRGRDPRLSGEAVAGDAVEGEHGTEQVRHALGGDHVAGVQGRVGAEGREGRRDGQPPAAGDQNQRRAGEHRRAGVERQHEHARRLHLARQVVGLRQDGELDQEVARRREAVVDEVRRLAVAVRDARVEAEPAVLGGEVLGEGEVVERNVVVDLLRPVQRPGLVEEREQRRERGGQHEKRPAAAQWLCNARRQKPGQRRRACRHARAAPAPGVRQAASESSAGGHGR